jgi:hypothetical protein
MKRKWAVDSASSNNARPVQGIRHAGARGVVENGGARPPAPGAGAGGPAPPILAVPLGPRVYPLPLDFPAPHALVPDPGRNVPGVPHDGPVPLSLMQTLFVTPDGLTTTPPQLRSMNTHGDFSASLMFCPPPIIPRAPPLPPVLDRSASQTNAGRAEPPLPDPAGTVAKTGLVRETGPAQSLTEEGLQTMWAERQALIANWKHEVLRADLPYDVFQLIVQAALEGGAPDDVLQELVFLRNLGAVCKAFAVRVEELRGDPQWFQLRARAAAHERVILVNGLDFTKAFSTAFLRTRWRQPGLESRFDMARFGAHLRLDNSRHPVHGNVPAGGVAWTERPSGLLGPRKLGLGPMPLVCFGRLRYCPDSLEKPCAPSKIFREFVKRHGDQITDLSISEKRPGMSLDWLADLKGLQSLDLSGFSSHAAPRIANDLLVRLRQLAISEATLGHWLRSGPLRFEEWCAMEDLAIIGSTLPFSGARLTVFPPALRRLTADLTLLSNELVFPAGLEALRLSLDRSDGPEQLDRHLTKLGGLPAFSELVVVNSGAMVADQRSKALAVFLGGGSHRLRVLRMSNSDTEDVLPALTKVDSLVELELGFSMIKKDFVLLSQVVRKQPQLRVLTLNGEFIRENDGLAMLLDALAACANLHSLHLKFSTESRGKQSHAETLMKRLLQEYRNFRSVPCPGPYNSEIGDRQRPNWLLRPAPRRFDNGGS